MFQQNHPLRRLVPTLPSTSAGSYGRNAYRNPNLVRHTLCVRMANVLVARCIHNIVNLDTVKAPLVRKLQDLRTEAGSYDTGKPSDMVAGAAAPSLQDQHSLPRYRKVLSRNFNEKQQQKVINEAFAADNSVADRLRQWSDYMRGQHDLARSKNDIAKMRASPDWSVDWRVAFSILEREYQEGHFTTVMNAQIGKKFSPGKLRRLARISPRTSAVWKVPEPEIYTTKSFLTYIERLVSLQVPTPLQRLIYSDESSNFKSSDAHSFQVQRKLEYLFRDESLHPHFSTKAFEHAFRYLFRHNMLSTARHLLNIMIESKTPIHTTTCNMFLGSAAFHKDLRFFIYFLQVKRALKIPSNEETWSLFLKTLHSNSVKVKIIDEMERLGLCREPSILQNCVAEIIDLELRKTRTVTDSMDALFDRLTLRFGTSWLSVQVGNHVCSSLGDAGLLDQIPQVLTRMDQCGASPDGRTLAILLRQRLRMCDNDGALRVLKLFRNHFKVTLQPINLDILFLLNWQSRNFNACHVVWRAACHYGAITHTMKKLVLRSLVQGSAVKAGTSEERWKAEAGKFIVFSRPIDPNLTTLLELDERTSIEREQNFETKQTNIMALALTIIRHDQLACYYGPIRGGWFRYYMAAIQRDEVWAAGNALMTQSLNWKYSQAIRIEEEPTRKPHTYRPRDRKRIFRTNVNNADK